MIIGGIFTGGAIFALPAPSFHYGRGGYFGPRLGGLQNRVTPRRGSPPSVSRAVVAAHFTAPLRIKVHFSAGPVL